MPTLPLLRSFPPVARADAELLILGSMPGEESLRQRQYYAFPRNAFWRIAGELFGFDSALSYARRLAALRRARVALWDVVGACRRRGSLDSAIADAVPNDLPALLARCPRLRLVACNGGGAHAALRRFFPDLPLPVVRLPSTSPAAALYTFDRKLALWRAALAPFATAALSPALPPPAPDGRPTVRLRRSAPHGRLAIRTPPLPTPCPDS